MTIVTGTPSANFVHAVVLTGVTGDGVASGAAVNLIDPATGAVGSLSLGALLLGIEPAVAGGWPELSNFHSLTNLQKSELQWFGISVGERYLYLSLSHQRAR